MTNFIKQIKAAGVVGAGGAGFPTHIKLNAEAEYLIVNAAECEPLIETDKYLCRSFAPQIVQAVLAAKAHLHAVHAVIALKGKYRAEIEALGAAIRQAGTDIRLFEMGTFYPAGDEQTMVRQVTGRTVPERGLPLDVGCVVDNVGTMLSIYDATQGAPVTGKYLSVVGEVREPVMLHVPVGTPVSACVQAAQPLCGDYALILGGPMMGRVLQTPEEAAAAVVQKTTGNVIVLPREHYLIRHAALPLEAVRHQAKSACIQCRMCTDLCPRYLLGHQIRPHLVMRNLWRERTIGSGEEFLQAFGDAANCCDCGVCEMFSCPMGLSPRRVNQHMKQALRERGIQVPRREAPQARSALELRRTSTGRLISRLGLSKYNGLHAGTCIELAVDEVFIPFAQHIGKPAVPVKQAGDTVALGELLAAAAKGVSANIHASISGTVTEINENGARIRKQ